MKADELTDDLEWLQRGIGVCEKALGRRPPTEEPEEWTLALRRKRNLLRRLERIQAACGMNRSAAVEGSAGVCGRESGRNI
jgi:hypothetical protein